MEKVRQNQTEVVKKHTSIKDLAAALQKEAQENKIFNAVCHMFALRERTRAQVTLSTLKASTDKEGYEFNVGDLEAVLKFLASLGIGRLEKNSKGRILALKDIQYTLQSVGQAAIEKKENMDKFSPAKSYKDIPVVSKAVEPAPVKDPVRYQAVFTVTVAGEPLTFSVPQGLTPETLAQLLSHIYKIK